MIAAADGKQRCHATGATHLTDVGRVAAMRPDLGPLQVRVAGSAEECMLVSVVPRGLAYCQWKKIKVQAQLCMNFTARLKRRELLVFARTNPVRERHVQCGIACCSAICSCRQQCCPLWLVFDRQCLQAVNTTCHMQQTCYHL